MKIPPTIRLYLQDDHFFESTATIIAVSENSIAADQTCFYPGGGGQPPDEGTIQLSNGEKLEVVSVSADSDGVLWHILKSDPPRNIVGETCQLMLNKARRLALMRYHTVLHVLNTITLRDYNGWITGVQIDENYSRIDFKLDGFNPSMAIELEEKVNRVLAGDHALRSYYVSEDEFRQRTSLLRTLEARPPISNSRVRVVEIEGFDEQACGGTHVPSTGDVGRFTIYKIDNRGKQNKRFYVRLEEV